jgi:predicted Zn-ribbon and HTH transcriptional regulator
MFRRDLVPLLLEKKLSLSEIARAVHEKPRDIIDALTHLAKSSKHSDYVLEVTPAECRKCGFEFSTEKFSRPGKCPKCHATWIFEPLIGVVRKAAVHGDSR